MPPSARTAGTSGTARAGMGGSRDAGGMVYAIGHRGCGPRGAGHRTVSWAAAEERGAGHDPHVGIGKGSSGTES